MVIFSCLFFLLLLCLFTSLLGLSRRGEKVEGAGEKIKERSTSSHRVGMGIGKKSESTLLLT